MERLGTDSEEGLGRCLVEVFFKHFGKIIYQPVCKEDSPSGPLLFYAFGLTFHPMAASKEHICFPRVISTELIFK